MASNLYLEESGGHALNPAMSETGVLMQPPPAQLTDVQRDPESFPHPARGVSTPYYMQQVLQLAPTSWSKMGLTTLLSFLLVLALEGGWKMLEGEVKKGAIHQVALYLPYCGLVFLSSSISFGVGGAFSSLLLLSLDIRIGLQASALVVTSLGALGFALCVALATHMEPQNLKDEHEDAVDVQVKLLSLRFLSSISFWMTVCGLYTKTMQSEKLVVASLYFAVPLFSVPEGGPPPLFQILYICFLLLLCAFLVKITSYFSALTLELLPQNEGLGSSIGFSPYITGGGLLEPGLYVGSHLGEEVGRLEQVLPKNLTLHPLTARFLLSLLQVSNVALSWAIAFRGADLVVHALTPDPSTGFLVRFFAALATMFALPLFTLAAQGLREKLSDPPWGTLNLDRSHPLSPRTFESLFFPLVSGNFFCSVGGKEGSPSLACHALSVLLPIATFSLVMATCTLFRDALYALQVDWRGGLASDGLLAWFVWLFVFLSFLAFSALSFFFWLNEPSLAHEEPKSQINEKANDHRLHLLALHPGFRVCCL